MSVTPRTWAAALAACLVCLMAGVDYAEGQDITLEEGVWNRPVEVTAHLRTTGEDTIPFEVVGVFNRQGAKVDADIFPSEGQLGPANNYFAQGDSAQVDRHWPILIQLPRAYDCPGRASPCPRYPAGSRLELQVRLHFPGGDGLLDDIPRTETRFLTLIVKDLYGP